MIHTIHVRRPEHPELVLHLHPSTMDVADSLWKGNLREGNVCIPHRDMNPPVTSPLLWHYSTCGTLTFISLSSQFIAKLLQ